MSEAAQDRGTGPRADTGPGAGLDEAAETASEVERWDAELRAYETAARDWLDHAKRIVKRYGLKDRGRPALAGDSQFNVLWSNIQTILPALFARMPAPVVERRHQDPDPIGRIAAQVLERALATEMERDDFIEAFGRVVLDTLLVGRGVPWVRYDAQMNETPLTTTEDGLLLDADGRPVSADAAEQRGDGWVLEEIGAERAPVDYVYWQDFWHKPTKSWAELAKDGWVARRVTMNKRQGRARFGAAFDEVPLSAKPEGMKGELSEHLARAVGLAEIFEIWDAGSRRVLWLCRGHKQALLDRQDDPLGLEGFFPCPMPAYGTLTNDSLMPVPDYLQYEVLARELDELTERISVLTRALRVRGVYDESMEKLGLLLDDSGPDNTMVGVANMAAYLGKGSAGSTLQGVVQFLPIDMIIATLAGLYDARERVKHTLYEVSGISDIIRGQVDPREKLGQSRIKAQFGTQRLDRRRQVVQFAARDVIRLKAEIIAEHFEPATIRELSGFDQLPEIARLLGTSPDGPMLAEQIFGQVMRLIASDKLRGFRIDIETDSTIEMDAAQAKQDRIAFLGAAGTFLEKSLPLAQAVPAMAPLLGEMLLFTVRSFRAGRSLEAAFEDAVEQLKQPPASRRQRRRPPAPCRPTRPRPRRPSAKARRSRCKRCAIRPRSAPPKESRGSPRSRRHEVAASCSATARWCPNPPPHGAASRSFATSRRSSRPATAP